MQAVTIKPVLVRAKYLPQVVSFKFGAEGSSTTSTSYVVIADSDIALDMSDYRGPNGKLYLKFIAHIYNDSSGETTYVRIYRQDAGTAVSGTELSGTGAGWTIAESDWVDMSTESGSESYQIQMKVTGGTGMYNSAIMILSPYKLW